MRLHVDVSPVETKQARLHLASCTVGFEGFDCRFKNVRWNPHSNRMEPIFSTGRARGG